MLRVIMCVPTDPRGWRLVRRSKRSHSFGFVGARVFGPLPLPHDSSSSRDPSRSGNFSTQRNVTGKTAHARQVHSRPPAPPKHTCEHTDSPLTARPLEDRHAFLQPENGRATLSWGLARVPARSRYSGAPRTSSVLSRWRPRTVGVRSPGLWRVEILFGVLVQS